jgi:hypothetical protein
MINVKRRFDHTVDSATAWLYKLQSSIVIRVGPAQVIRKTRSLQVAFLCWCGGATVMVGLVFGRLLLKDILSLKYSRLHGTIAAADCHYSSNRDRRRTRSICYLYIFVFPNPVLTELCL